MPSQQTNQGWSGSGFPGRFDPDAIGAPRPLPPPNRPRPSVAYGNLDSQWGGPWSTPLMRPAPLPGPTERPFGGYLQSKRRHWGRRLFLLLVAAGAVVHFTRAYVPAFDRLETRVRETALAYTAEPRALVNR